MTTDIVVPVLGESVTEATIAKWLKKTGDVVAVDEPIVELETEKATVELGAPNAGVLAEILAPEGADVAVGAVIGRIAPAEGAREAPRAPQVSEEAAAPEPARAPATAPARAAAEPDPRSARRSAPGNRISADDLRGFLGETGGDASRSGPAARKLLAEHGLEASAVPATGPGGRVTKGDVLAHVAAGATAAAPAAVASPASPAPREQRVRMTRLRRTIAARLVEAQSTAAILTTFNEIDMGAVMDARARHKDAFEKKHGVRLGFTSFFAKAVVAALREVPEVNAEIDGDEIVFKNYYDLGMAVSAPSGLVVPVVRECDRKSFAEIEAALAELAARARDGKLSPEEMRGGTFTISNGGVFGSLLSTPILNRPQSGILGLHKIEERPIARGGQVVIRPMMYVALSYDHRLVDGREAVTFLVRVKEAIEDPERLLLDV
ncbi:MAG TPA: 2-oxoglutarate dehydrogenase complex dihydrolipoyllysine-residue succinyltransferase [Myxococcota bacterium]|nr:2-oxoglutarate dehydrogenase complex dihydrolipoyllysine-residue succinyltransferase [Myxococcota bacterium]